MTEHHRIRATDPLPIRGGPAPVGDLVAYVRSAAIASIARDEDVTPEEAARILDALPPLAPTESPEAIAARRRDAEAARILRIVTELRMPVRPEVLPGLVRGECLRTAATSAAAQWMKSDRRVLVIVGDMGVGKTVSACLIACAYARRRRTIAYLREPGLVKWWHSTTLAHEAQVERLKEADLLIVDELGTTLSRDGERTRDAMFGLIDDRIGGEGRTVLLGNLTEKKLAEAYGARFLDRMREIGTVVHVTGESLRGRGA